MFLKNGLITGLAIGLITIPHLAKADVYRCSTDNGSVTLSNVEKGSNCKKMVLPPPEPKKPGSAKAVVSDTASSPKDVKAVDKPKSTYDSASMERKRIIQEEMDLEKARLSAVQGRIKDLSATPNKSPDQLKELVSLQQKENLHASNLQILQKELNK